MIDLFARIVFIVVVCFLAILLFKNFDQKGFIENYKFEIKKAKDMHHRLDDVKGIDEIKEEIHNLIKMIREPEVYTSKGAKLHKGVLLFG